MRSVDSLSVKKRVVASSWTSLDLETLEIDVSPGKSAGAIAKDRGWPNSRVRQRVAAIKRGDPVPRYVGGVERRLTPELVDEIREIIQLESGPISVKIVSNRFTYLQSKVHLLSALASVGDPYSTPFGGPSHPVRRRDAGEVGACIWKAHLDVLRNESTAGCGRDLLQRSENLQS